MNYVIGWFFCLPFRFRSTSSHVNGSDGIRSGVERKRKPSDPSDSDCVELTIPIPSSFFDSHWNGRFLMLPITNPLPIPSSVWTSPNSQKVSVLIKAFGQIKPNGTERKRGVKLLFWFYLPSIFFKVDSLYFSWNMKNKVKENQFTILFNNLLK